MRDKAVTTKAAGSIKPQLPPAQTCAKCGAEFRWEPSDPMVKGSPLVARLSKPADDCDCGYGSLPSRLGD